jgi:hypothetical protein
VVHRFVEDWSGAALCGIGNHPRERIFWDASVRGPVNDPSIHTGRVALVDPFGVEVMPAPSPTVRLVPDEDHAAEVRLVAPRLFRNGQVYDWSTAIPTVPMGYTAEVPTAGRYRLPDLSHTGRDLRLAYRPEPDRFLFTAGTFDRPYVTRASIRRFEVRAGAPSVSARHPVLSDAAVEVRQSPECTAAIVNVLSE